MDVLSKKPIGRLRQLGQFKGYEIQKDFRDRRYSRMQPQDI